MNLDADLVEEPLDEEVTPSRPEVLAKFEEDKEAAEAEAAAAPPQDDEGAVVVEPLKFDNLASALQSASSAFLRISCAAWRSRCARSWTKLIYNCEHLWNFVTAMSLPPHLFSRDTVLDRSIRFSSGPLLRTATYLLDMCEILALVPRIADDESVAGDVVHEETLKQVSKKPSQIAEPSRN